MATLKLVIEIPGWTAAQLKQVVRDVDTLVDEIPIDLDKVRASDILTLIYVGDLGITEPFTILDNDLGIPPGPSDPTSNMTYIINEVED